MAKLVQKYLKLDPDDVLPLPTPPAVEPTPAPTPTPEPGACVDGATYVADLNYDDKNMTAPPVMQPGQPFTKGWRLRNSGTCAWDQTYTFAYASGNSPLAQMGGRPFGSTARWPRAQPTISKCRSRLPNSQEPIRRFGR